MQDYYRALELPRDASQLAIKRAYRKLAKQCHPDLHPADPTAAERFRELNTAYEVLGEPNTRWEYDRELMGFQSQPEPHYPKWTAREVGFETFERSWFGGGLHELSFRDFGGAAIGAFAGAIYVLARPPVQAEALIYALFGSVAGSSFGGSLGQTLRDLVGTATGVVASVVVGSVLAAGTSGFLWYWGTIFAWTQAPPDEPGALLAFRGVVGAILGGGLGAVASVLRRTADKRELNDRDSGIQEP